ncbi:MAG: hypothetical protein WDO73_29950 [Ignavibacteriota bacterium]
MVVLDSAIEVLLRATRLSAHQEGLARIGVEGQRFVGSLFGLLWTVGEVQCLRESAGDEAIVRILRGGLLQLPDGFLVIAALHQEGAALHAGLYKNPGRSRPHACRISMPRRSGPASAGHGKAPVRPG